MPRASPLPRPEGRKKREIWDPKERLLPPVIPLCVRWRDEDFAQICRAARAANERASPWIRKVVLERVEALLDGRRVPSLPEAFAGTRMLCIRFRPFAMARVKRAANRERTRPTEWIRAIAVARAHVGTARASLATAGVAS